MSFSTQFLLLLMRDGAWWAVFHLLSWFTGCVRRVPWLHLAGHHRTSRADQTSTDQRTGLRSSHLSPTRDDSELSSSLISSHLISSHLISSHLIINGIQNLDRQSSLFCRNVARTSLVNLEDALDFWDKSQECEYWGGEKYSLALSR